VIAGAIATGILLAHQGKFIINRNGGRTVGATREFEIPNQEIPKDSKRRVIQ
jgi:hypothetical protein